jgi:protein involved in polysaccharide export with SLBB domain
MNGTLVMVFVAAVIMQVVAGAQVTIPPCTAVEVASGQCVVVIGKVERPGIYGFEAGLTVQQAIEKAGGIAEDPYGFSVIVWRLVEGQRTQLDTALGSALQPNDVLEVKPEPPAIPPPTRMPTELLKSLLFGRSVVDDVTDEFRAGLPR